MSDSLESNKRRRVELNGDDAKDGASAVTAPDTDAEVKFAYSVDDTVLAYHGPLMYQAKVLDRKEKDGTALYKIHFVNWNKRYDEWATANRLFDNNRENKADAAKLLADAKKAEEAARVEKLPDQPKRKKAKKSDGKKGTETVESLRRELNRVKRERDAMKKELKRIKDGVSRLV